MIVKKICFLVVVMTFVATDADGFNGGGGIRNFKFRKKDPDAPRSKSVDLKRYFDGELRNFFAFEGFEAD